MCVNTMVFTMPMRLASGAARSCDPAARRPVQKKKAPAAAKVPHTGGKKLIIAEKPSVATDIARARETCKFARMDLERRRPALYGQRQQVQLELGPALSARLERAEQRVNCNGTATEIGR